MEKCSPDRITIIRNLQLNNNLTIVLSSNNFVITFGFFFPKLTHKLEITPKNFGIERKIFQFLTL